MRGRKPNPATVYDAPDSGFVGVAAEAPDPPEPVLEDPDARAAWERLCPELLKARRMAKIFEGTLAAYCIAYADFIKASRQIRALEAEIDTDIQPLGAYVVRTPNGFPVVSPIVTIRNKAAEQMRTYSAALGLSPVDLARSVEADFGAQGDLFGDEAGPKTPAEMAHNRLERLLNGGDAEAA